ncbi:MAG: hypothetical protein IKP99_02655, partial [Bacteroidales bacterium]|nr:hypothetical protein [Bacteroidales bacterium]
MRKYLSNKKIGLYLIGAILLISFIFLAWISHVWLETEIASQLFAAIAGAIIAAIMTMLLLNKQSESEELKDRNMAVFNQKQSLSLSPNSGDEVTDAVDLAMMSLYMRRPDLVK